MQGLDAFLHDATQQGTVPGAVVCTGCSLWIDLEHQVTVILCTHRVHPTRQATGMTALRPAVHHFAM